MTIYWVRAESENALSAVDAVERALVEGDTGEPPVAPRPTGPARGELEPYLQENLALLHTTWSVDPNQILWSQRPGLAAALDRFQGLARRVTLWYTLPQWLQANEFHGAVVRVIDSLLNRQRQDRELAERVPAIERRLDVMRMEQRQLRRRIAMLEAQLAEYAKKREE